MGIKKSFNRLFAPHKALDKLNDKGQTLLTRAVEEGDRITIRNLLDAKAGPDVKDGKGRTPLSLAIAANDHAIVDQLLKGGADPSAKYTDDDGVERLPLNTAAAKGDVALAKRLLQARAFPSTPDGAGKTALDVSREAGHDKITAMFVEVERREKERLRAMAMMYGHPF